MKKLFLPLMGVYMLVVSSVQSLEAVIGSAAMGAVQGLMPILEPLAQETLMSAVKHFKEVAAGKSCPITCTGPIKSFCRSTHTTFSVCKDQCQEVKTIGGFELRVRFSDKWSLLKCMRIGVKNGFQTQQGKSDHKSIALYSQEDLDYVLNILKYKVAADTIVSTKGANLKESDLRKAKVDKLTAVQEAADLSKHIEQAIKTDVEKGRFPYQ